MVGAGGDHAVDLLGACEPVDRRLVLDRDDRAAVGVAEPRRRGVAVGRDDVQPAGPRRREHAELGRSGPEDEQARHGAIVAERAVGARQGPTPRKGEAGTRRRRHAARPCLRRRQLIGGLVLALAAVAYAGVFAAFVMLEKPGLGIGHFFYVPICLVALVTDGALGAITGVADGRPLRDRGRGGPGCPVGGRAHQGDGDQARDVRARRRADRHCTRAATGSSSTTFATTRAAIS